MTKKKKIKPKSTYTLIPPFSIELPKGNEKSDLEKIPEIYDIA